METCRAWLWATEAAAPNVLGLAGYAQAFASQGMAALAFDYRHFGNSGGSPVKSSTWQSSKTTTAPRCGSRGTVTG